MFILCLCLTWCEYINSFQKSQNYNHASVITKSKIIVILLCLWCSNCKFVPCYVHWGKSANCKPRYIKRLACWFDSHIGAPNFIWIAFEKNNHYAIIERYLINNSINLFAYSKICFWKFIIKLSPFGKTLAHTLFYWVATRGANTTWSAIYWRETKPCFI